METLVQGNVPGVADATANIPSYGFITQIMLKAFGVDVGNIVSVYLVLVGVYQGAVFFYNKVRDYFL
jgi:hypothetical protein